MKIATTTAYRALLRALVPLIFLMGVYTHLLAQTPSANNTVITNKFGQQFSAPTKADLFGISSCYIQNVGQYGSFVAGFENMGKILYGYEGIAMPVLFTPRGIIHIQRKAAPPTYRAKRKMERKGMEEEEIEKMIITVNKVVTLEWVGANPNPQIIETDQQSAYHVYGLSKEKAKGFKKIIYKELYPGIDAEFSFLSAGNRGFEYKLLVKPGADISVVKMRYGGNVQSVDIDKQGGLFVRSSIDTIMQSAPVCFRDDNRTGTGDAAEFTVSKKTVGFKLPEQYNRNIGYTIDPFVSSTSNLTGTNIGKAKDIDFDYDGNIYVTGGGDGGTHKLAKFNGAGTLLWTFSGSITTPPWNFGGSYGGWVVEKQTGNSYLGQGLAGAGFSVVRINAAGVYDSYISTPNSSFGENWKMIWSCNGGVPKMLIAGGGGSANNEVAVLSPPSTTPTVSSLTGLTGGHSDISDIVIDDVTNDMYTIFSRSVIGIIDNKMFRHAPPYNTTSTVWGAPSGFTGNLTEPSNRPYLGSLENSSNVLAVNTHYLFYFDGANLRAYDKATGNPVGNRLTVTGSGLLQEGGIYADECNNIFTGSLGMVKTYKFDGTNFDDFAIADIPIAGFSGKSVYDLAYDNARKLLYASGNGFVGSFDISAFCPATLYKVKIVPNCGNLSATATVEPTPPAGTTVTYVLYNGATQLASNATGIFTGLATGINYTIKAFLNQACGGTQAVDNFTLTNPPSLVITNPNAVCLPGTANLTAPAITNGSSPGLTYTYWEDAAATIPLATPAAATAPGTYYIQAAPISGCLTISPVVVTSLPSPTANAGPDETICFSKSTQLHASGGQSYQWTPSTFLDDPTSQNPKVIKPTPGTITYHLVVTDPNGCKSQVDEEVSITVSGITKLFAGNDTVIAFNQPLQLHAIDVNNSGFTSYTWSPIFGLDNPSIADPIAHLDRDIFYAVKASTPAGCEATAYIRIKVYKGPEIYVPSAFTPNNDGNNDLVKAVTVGLTRLNYFRIYNRWGQLVFTTTDDRIGWDGKIEGKDQASAVFVWTAEGVDYKGNILRRKGTVTLIR